MTIEALRQYILLQVASQRELALGSLIFIFLEWDKIWALNKKIIDPVSPRFAAVHSEKVVKVNIIGES